VRDVSLLCIVLASAGLALYRPWLGVLALAVVGYMHPQSYATGFMHGFPAYEVVFIAVVAGWALSRQRPALAMDWRLVALLALWAYFLFTTYHAKVPWAAWPRFGEVSKIFLSLGLTVLLIDTREKLFFLIATIAASFALVTIKGGYWAVMTGFADRVYGPPASQYHDNNLFAIAVIMNIPLLVLWLRETRNERLRYLLMAAIALSAAAAVSSWSRGGLIALAVTVLVLLCYSRRRLLMVPLLIAAVALALLSLPEAWFERMHTIATYEQEGSAQRRLDAWGIGLKHALVFPLTGVGLDGWHYAVVTMDWHNSYVEMMAEHGFIAFGLWCLLLFGTIVSLMRLARTGAGSSGPAWVRNYSQMLAASLVAYASGSMFLGLAYWDIMYHLLVIAVVLSAIARRASGIEENPVDPAPREIAQQRA
jgi:probable O-glycosylation ligase (exosortase A-associated)